MSDDTDKFKKLCHDILSVCQVSNDKLTGFIMDWIIVIV